MFMGMNPTESTLIIVRTGVPHVHGDEPRPRYYMLSVCVEFPMFMGMNLWQKGSRVLAGRVPHVHGDEPGQIVESHKEAASSPCSWG